MKQIGLFIILYICLSFSIYGQDTIDVSKALSGRIAGVSIPKDSDKYKTIHSTNEYEPVYFVLGTLSDYMGRFQYVDRERQIDRYYPYEEPVVRFLATYIKDNLNTAVDTIFKESGHKITSRHGEMYSESLSKTLNSFYGSDDKLLDSSFKTNEQINSFLAGVYYRYGEKMDSTIYKIQLANSPKHQNCYNLLKHIGCRKIFYKYLNNIPSQYILYFEPTDGLKMYLDIIEPQRLILQRSNYIMMSELMKKDLSEIERMSEETREARAPAVREMFK